MRKQVCILLLSICFIGGCSFVPFKKTEYILITNRNPEDVLRKHIALTPESFKIINTVVFQFRARKFLSLVYLSVDENEKAFELAGMNSVGVKLIEIAAKNGEVTVNNVIDEISKKGDISKALVKDIYRIYFDQAPLKFFEIKKKKKEIIFSQKQDAGITEYVFAGKENYLIEKVHYEGKKKAWSARYYEYMEKDGKVYPKGIIFANYLYGYKLIINVKEVL